MRRGLVLGCALLGLWTQHAAGQEPAVGSERPALAILTLDDERLFSGSAFGKAVIARNDAEAAALIEENRRIEAALEAEEKDLTARRATMTRDEFLPLSEGFNSKVEGIRRAQDSKSRDLNRRFEDDRLRFLQAARPILTEVMAAAGAAAIIDRRAVFVGFDNIDITDAAIARLDAAFADGSLSFTAP